MGEAVALLEEAGGWGLACGHWGGAVDGHVCRDTRCGGVGTGKRGQARSTLHSVTTTYNASVVVYNIPFIIDFQQAAPCLSYVRCSRACPHHVALRPAAAVARRHYGPRHPSLLAVLLDLGEALAAEEAAERGVQGQEAQQGEGERQPAAVRRAKAAEELLQIVQVG